MTLGSSSPLKGPYALLLFKSMQHSLQYDFQSFFWILAENRSIRCLSLSNWLIDNEITDLLKAPKREANIGLGPALIFSTKIIATHLLGYMENKTSEGKLKGKFSRISKYGLNLFWQGLIVRPTWYLQRMLS